MGNHSDWLRVDRRAHKYKGPTHINRLIDNRVVVVPIVYFPEYISSSTSMRNASSGEFDVALFRISRLVDGLAISSGSASK
jgi:Na+(H+)/acetate symporter ActP